MADHVPPTPPEAATPTQIETAYKSLTHRELKVIDRIAQTLAWPDLRAGSGWTAEDLEQEALLRSLDGRRRWFPKEVDFVRFLAGVMRSIASEWRRRGQRWSQSLEGLEDEGASKETRVQLSAVSASATEEAVRQKEVRDELVRLRARFAGDDEVEFILMGIEDGLGRAEIIEAAGMTLKAYDAARNRLIRAVRAERGRGEA